MKKFICNRNLAEVLFGEICWIMAFMELAFVTASIMDGLRDFDEALLWFTDAESLMMACLMWAIIAVGTIVLKFFYVLKEEVRIKKFCRGRW